MDSRPHLNILAPFIGTKEQTPTFLKDNEFIHMGYRVNHHSCCDAAKSLCTCHNESTNVWSHLFGSIAFFLCFVWLTIWIIPDRFGHGRQLIAQFDTKEHSSNHLLYFIEMQKEALSD